MPRCLDPRVSFPIVLDSDKDKPLAERPTFQCKVLTAAERLHMHDVYEAAIDGRSAMLADFDSLRVAIVGWKCIRDRAGNDIDFDLSKLEQILDPDEAIELFNKVLTSNRLDHEGKVKSASPLGSATPKSASDAELADARTSETSGQPSASSAQAAREGDQIASIAAEAVS